MTEVFKSLQENLNKIEKDINFVERTDVQKERISQRLDEVIQRIDALTVNEAGKLEEQEVLVLKQQIERIKLAVWIKTTTDLVSLKTTINVNSSLANRPPEVQKNIKKSAENVEETLQNMGKEMPWSKWFINWIKWDDRA